MRPLNPVSVFSLLGDVEVVGGRAVEAVGRRELRVLRPLAKGSTPCGPLHYSEIMMSKIISPGLTFSQHALQLWRMPAGNRGVQENGYFARGPWGDP